MIKPPASGARRLLLIGLAAFALALVVAGLLLWLRPPASGPVAVTRPAGGDVPQAAGLVRLPPGSELGGPFQLVDQDGKTVTDASFAGKFMLIYFGFTFCPDVCPTELQAMATAIDDLGSPGDMVQPILISVDPARDTPAQLKSYVASFHPRLVGLSGSDEQVAAAAKAYRVYYAKGPVDADGNYVMDHTSFVYLMGPDGKLRSVFRAGASPEVMAAEMEKQLVK
ncbi:MAG TPA: SCO family protein [Alphaproteobacteria bacterium]|nr:SCO family protein [Alphaproteobacteria bacterium]